MLTGVENLETMVFQAVIALRSAEFEVNLDMEKNHTEPELKQVKKNNIN